MNIFIIKCDTSKCFLSVILKKNNNCTYLILKNNEMIQNNDIPMINVDGDFLTPLFFQNPLKKFYDFIK